MDKKKIITPLRSRLQSENRAPIIIFLVLMALLAALAICGYLTGAWESAFR